MAVHIILADGEGFSTILLTRKSPSVIRRSPVNLPAVKQPLTFLFSVYQSRYEKRAESQDPKYKTHTMFLFYWRLAKPGWMLILSYTCRLSLGNRSVIFTFSLTSHKNILRLNAREKMRETVEVQTFLLSSVETMTGMVMQNRDNFWKRKKKKREEKQVNESTLDCQ